MDWKGLIAILIAALLAGVGAFTGRCSDALFMICTAIVGGVFGLARSGGGNDNRRVHAEIHPPPLPPP